MISWSIKGEVTPHPHSDPQSQRNGPFLGEAHPSGEMPTGQPDPEPLTSERMTLTMRKALDTSVVTCPGGGGRREGTQRLGSEPLHLGPCPSPRAQSCRDGGSYRNHPPVPEPQHRVAQEQPGEAEEGQDLGVGVGEPSQASQCPFPWGRLPPASPAPRLPRVGAHALERAVSQCLSGDNLDVTFLDPSLSTAPSPRLPHWGPLRWGLT